MHGVMVTVGKTIIQLPFGAREQICRPFRSTCSLADPFYFFFNKEESRRAHIHLTPEALQIQRGP
jgi:hypothetical protein